MTLSRWYHSIKFVPEGYDVDDANVVDTWNSWHLIPITRPVVNPPSLKTTIVEMPGVDGEIDLSDFLDPYPVYTNRKGSWEFAVKNGFESWNVLYSKIMNYFNYYRGKFNVILQDDLAYRYNGRLSVNQWESNESFSVITIDYDLWPYKDSLNDTSEKWEWDIFDFETGYINDLTSITLSGSGSISIFVGFYDKTKSVDYITTNSSGITMVYLGKSYPLNLGKNYFPDIMLEYGTHTFNFTGNGSVSISYRRERL